MRWPSWMPAGTSTSSCRSSTTTRRRCTCGTGARRSRRGPRTAGRRACARTRRTGCASHLLQAAGAAAARAAWRLVPGSTPSPPHVPHATATSNGTSTFVAARRLDELDLDLGADVGAARGATRAPPPNRSSPKNAEKRSPRLPRSKLRRLEPARAQAGVAEAVVELRASRSSTAPRTPRSPRGSAPRPRASDDTSGCSSRASRRNAFLIAASSASRGTPSSS